MAVTVAIVAVSIVLSAALVVAVIARTVAPMPCACPGATVGEEVSRSVSIPCRGDDDRMTIASAFPYRATEKRAGVRLAGDVVLLATADEEDESEFGAEFVARHRSGWLAGLDTALSELGGILDRSALTRPIGIIGVSEKTGLPLRLRARGAPGHGSVPWPNGAPHRLALAVCPAESRRGLTFFLTAAIERSTQAHLVFPVAPGAVIPDLCQRETEGEDVANAGARPGSFGTSMAAPSGRHADFRHLEGALRCHGPRRRQLSES